METMKNKQDKDIYYMSMAYYCASKKSTDSQTHNGAVLIKNGKIIGYGANHFPKGVKETKARWKRPTKYSFVCHAETNAIYNAAKLGHSTYGATLYCPWCACDACGRAIIQAGIKRVVRHKVNSPNKKWDDSIKIALEMFKESGVKYEEIEHDFGMNIRRNGKTIKV